MPHMVTRSCWRRPRNACQSNMKGTVRHVKKLISVLSLKAHINAGAWTAKGLMCVVASTGMCVLIYGTLKIFESQQIPQKSILRTWYTQIQISQPHGINKRPKTSPGDGLGGELTTFHQ